MKHVRTIPWMLLLLALGSGCDDKGGKPTPPGTSGPSIHDHEHGSGPHGGVVFDLGKYHAEFTVDHDKKECTVYILGADEVTPTPIAAKDLTLSIKETKTEDGIAVPAMTINLQPRDVTEGKASTFVGSDPGLGMKADFEGTVTGLIDDKPAKGSFKEDDHDRGKK